MSREILNALSKHLLELAVEQLETTEQLRPFAFAVQPNGEFLAVGGEAGELDFREFIAVLQLQLESLAIAGSIQASGICCDVLLHSEGSPARDAVQCRLEHADGKSLRVMAPYLRSESDRILLEEAAVIVFEREVFGLQKFVLTLEGIDVIKAPSLLQLDAAVEMLTPDGGPGYLIVEAQSGDFSQVAGGAGRYLAEWGEQTGEGVKHLRAGYPGRPDLKSVKVATNDAFVTVRENEVLTSHDAQEILRAFVLGQGRPVKYQWRDFRSPKA